MLLGKRFRKAIRNVSVYVPLTDIGIRKMSGVRKVTVFYRFTAVYGPYCFTWGSIVVDDDGDNEISRIHDFI